jgi:two-component system heavy metal sensor histidine kinase CusS
MKTSSIRFKTTVLYSGVLCIILACFSLYLFDTIRQTLYGETKQDLQVKARQIEAFLDAYASISPKNNTPASLMKQFLSSSGEGAIPGKEIIDQLWAQDSKSLGLGNDFFRILSPRGRVRLRSDNLTNDIEGAFITQFPPHSDSIRFTNLQFNKAAFYGISYPFRFSNRNSFIIQLATPLDSVQRILSKLVFFIITGIVTIILVTLFMGSFLTRRILKPVTEITLTANNISQTNLNMRIPQQKLDHEMEELVGSFNRMIERLEQSFAHINEFSSHVAHELKTPLAIIKSELELALVGENPKKEDMRVMSVTLGEIDRLIKTIKDLLLLAKLEYKLNIFKMEEIDIVEFLKDIYQHSKVLAAQKNIAIELVIPDHPVLIEGDVIHLRRILFNLLHNAVKFTPVQGKIKIIAEVRKGQFFISVKDTGIGIAPADQQRIFEKFFRIHRTDQEDTSGSGLGLCLARTVARSHGGDITFESELGKGSTFTVNLPLCKV